RMQLLETDFHRNSYDNRLSTPKTSRVLAVAPMPPEKVAYALARYSRSPDSIRDSVAWVRTHDSTKFLESFYSQYGHASIADLGFDVARYTLFLGIPAGVGQVTSIRTLERQIRRLKSSEYAEIRELAAEIADACAQPPACAWDENIAAEPLAPTLARHVEP